MKIVLVKDRVTAAKMASQQITRLMQDRFKTVLGLATGSSPILLYQELVREYKDRGISFAHTTSFNLDEYIGLDASNPQCFRYYMQEHLFQHVDFCPQVNYFPILYRNPEQYDRLIEQAGGIDLQILGIGSNGHIGFNEPGTDFNSATHIVQLSELTRRDNSRFFSDIESVPRTAITMGIGTIMKARSIILLAFGMRKADSVKAMIDGRVTDEVPASILQKHQNVTIIVDYEAGSKIERELQHELA